MSWKILIDLAVIFPPPTAPVFAARIYWKEWRDGTSSWVLSKRISGSGRVSLTGQEVLVDVRSNGKGNVLTPAFSSLLLHVSLCIHLSHPVFWIESVQQKKKKKKIALTMLSLRSLNFAAFFGLQETLFISSFSPFPTQSWTLHNVPLVPLLSVLQLCNDLALVQTGGIA